jgi:hypothetical protein
MKTQILEYLNASKLQKKLIFSLRKAPWFSQLEKEFVNMNLPADWNLQRKLWHYWNNTNVVPLCPLSGQERKWRAGNAVERIDIPGMSEGYSVFANYKVAGKGNVEIRKNSLVKKYGEGITNPMYIPGVAEKRKNHFIEKYGVENPSSAEQVKQKRINTMMERHGIPHNLVNWQEKFFNKFGVYNPAHIPEIAEKICYNRFKKRREYMLSNGEIIQLQGYEPYGFDYLKKLYDEDKIKYRKRDMPKLWYNWQNKTRRYYCDFFVPEDNLVVEIKSSFTLSRDFDIVKQKILSAQTNGYTVLLLVFDQYGQVVSLPVEIGRLLSE